MHKLLQLGRMAFSYTIFSFIYFIITITKENEVNWTKKCANEIKKQKADNKRDTELAQ